VVNTDKNKLRQDNKVTELPDLQPTSSLGTLGQKRSNSGNHFSSTFCKVDLLSIEKQTRNTSVSG